MSPACRTPAPSELEWLASGSINYEPREANRLIQARASCCAKSSSSTSRLWPKTTARTTTSIRSQGYDKRSMPWITQSMKAGVRPPCVDVAAAMSKIFNTRTSGEVLGGNAAAAASLHHHQQPSCVRSSDFDLARLRHRVPIRSSFDGHSNVRPSSAHDDGSPSELAAGAQFRRYVVAHPSD